MAREAIDVTPALLDRRLIVVTGKGGTGKSTVSAALALAACKRRKRVLVCEVTARERSGIPHLARALRHLGSETGASPLPIEEAVDRRAQQFGGRREAKAVHRAIF